eukprot:s698_g9.t1
MKPKRFQRHSTISLALIGPMVAGVATPNRPPLLLKAAMVRFDSPHKAESRPGSSEAFLGRRSNETVTDEELLMMPVISNAGQGGVVLFLDDLEVGPWLPAPLPPGVRCIVAPRSNSAPKGFARLQLERLAGPAAVELQKRLKCTSPVSWTQLVQCFTAPNEPVNPLWLKLASQLPEQHRQQHRLADLPQLVTITVELLEKYLGPSVTFVLGAIACSRVDVESFSVSESAMAAQSRGPDPWPSLRVATEEIRTYEEPRLLEGKMCEVRSCCTYAATAAAAAAAGAYEDAIKAFTPGDVCTVFTPDDTHFEICKAALQGGLHVLVTKPMVKTLAQHKELVSIAKEKGVLLQIEVHKRFDPIYNDARQRLQTLGNFGYFTSFMSQPKMQLETFRDWAGISSDISYYLNSHHVDFHVWAMQGIAKPVSVYATASTGTAEKILGRPCEDTITLNVVWQNHSGILKGSPGTRLLHEASSGAVCAGECPMHSVLMLSVVLAVVVLCTPVLCEVFAPACNTSEEVELLQKQRERKIEKLHTSDSETRWCLFFVSLNAWRRVLVLLVRRSGVELCSQQSSSRAQRKFSYVVWCVMVLEARRSRTFHF